MIPSWWPCHTPCYLPDLQKAWKACTWGMTLVLVREQDERALKDILINWHRGNTPILYTMQIWLSCRYWMAPIDLLCNINEPFLMACQACNQTQSIKNRPQGHWEKVENDEVGNDVKDVRRLKWENCLTALSIWRHFQVFMQPTRNIPNLFHRSLEHSGRIERVLYINGVQCWRVLVRFYRTL